MSYAENFLKAIDFRNELFKNEEPINRDVLKHMQKSTIFQKLILRKCMKFVLISCTLQLIADLYSLCNVIQLLTN